jgi:SAM-dependent methyltransferase
MVALGAPATWNRCDVLEVPAELDGTADMIHTGRGAIAWIHDFEAWARTVARLLKPGGLLHLMDDHPILGVVEARDGRLALRDENYFKFAVASKGWPASYIPELSGDARDPHGAKAAGPVAFTGLAARKAREESLFGRRNEGLERPMAR